MASPAKGLAIIVADKMAKGSGGPKADDGGDNYDDEEIGLESAMSELIAAVKKGDAAAAAQAFRDAHDICAE